MRIISDDETKKLEVDLQVEVMICLLTPIAGSILYLAMYLWYEGTVTVNGFLAGFSSGLLTVAWMLYRTREAQQPRFKRT